MLALNAIHQGDCVTLMAQLPDGSIDLTVTSPPYDGLRTYNGYSFDFEAVAAELYRVTKQGGVVVWVVGDATVKGSETGTSFRQALHFIQCGFSLHDTMIYSKKNVFAFDPRNKRYKQSFEYMFVMSKGSPLVANLIQDRPTKKVGSNGVTSRNPSGKQREPKAVAYKPFQVRFNVWEYGLGFNQSSKDKIAFEHPAIFPEKLAADHILSWSNPGNIVLDPFSGSGTTAKMAHVHGRKYLGFEISGEYAQISRARLQAIENAPQLTF